MYGFALVGISRMEGTGASKSSISHRMVEAISWLIRMTEMLLSVVNALNLSAMASWGVSARTRRARGSGAAAMGGWQPGRGVEAHPDPRPCSCSARQRRPHPRRPAGTPSRCPGQAADRVSFARRPGRAPPRDPPAKPPADVREAALGGAATVGAFGRRSRRAPGGVLRTSSAMTEIIVARPVIPAIFAFHSAILGALRYRAAPKLFEA